MVKTCNLRCFRWWRIKHRKRKGDCGWNWIRNPNNGPDCRTRRKKSWGRSPRGDCPKVQTGLVQRVYWDWNVEGAASAEQCVYFHGRAANWCGLRGRDGDAPRLLIFYQIFRKLPHSTLNEPNTVKCTFSNVSKIFSLIARVVSNSKTEVFESVWNLREEYRKKYQIQFWSKSPENL